MLFVTIKTMYTLIKSYFCLNQTIKTQPKTYETIISNSGNIYAFSRTTIGCGTKSA